MKSVLSFTLNGRRRDDLVADNMLLMDYLRDVAGLTGTKQGCDGGECGACTVLVDDQPRLSCSTLALQVSGRRVETIEGLTQQGRLSVLQQAFHEKLGTQCGFCTPGMIMAAEAVKRDKPEPSRAHGTATCVVLPHPVSPTSSTGSAASTQRLTSVNMRRIVAVHVTAAAVACGRRAWGRNRRGQRRRRRRHGVNGGRRAEGAPAAAAAALVALCLSTDLGIWMWSSR